ncbi:MAG TPA: HAD family hydrolase [Firmicutes bacterium]|jgi:FMN phosphatase YigB (HAD superfamily)|nr:HAD family hydrolase [Bacillota bacterium]
MVYAVTFDLWNTLLYERNHERVADRLAEDLGGILAGAGYSIEETRLAQFIRECRAMVMRRQVDEGLDMAPEEQLAWILGRAGAAPTGQVAEKLLEFYTTARGGEEIRVMDGAVDTLRELAREYRLALICNTGRTPGKVIRPWLKEKGLNRYLEVLTFSNEQRIAKPNPRIFLHTLKQLGAVPERAAHVGDDPRTDLKGARTTGMIPVWFNPTGREDGPDWAYQVQRLSDLPALLAEIWT